MHFNLQSILSRNLKLHQEFKFYNGKAWYSCIGFNSSYVIYAMVLHYNGKEFLSDTHYYINYNKTVYTHKTD